MKKYFPIIIALIIAIFIISVAVLQNNWSLEINDFDSCITAGNPVLESYPRQCHDTISDKTFTEDLGLTEVIGEVSLKGEVFCPCFEIEGQMVWYDLMEGFKPIDVSEITNGDVVRVQGELQSNGEIYAFSIAKESLIGGERDEHGCLGPAGYSWNETDQMCVREWTRKKCSPESRGPELYCIQVYDPVCGLPIKANFSNSCLACLNSSVEHYVEGECQ